MPQFAEELERLLDEVGPVSVASAEEAVSRTDASSEGENPVDVLVTLESSEGVDPSPVRWVVVEQDGEQCLAGRTTARDFALSFEPDNVVDLGQPGAAVDTIPPSLDDPNFEVVLDAAIGDDDLDDGAVSGWSRVWMEDDFGGARVHVTQYESVEAARGAAVDRIRSILGDAVETFAIPGVDGPFGVRSQGSAWLWVQPLASGPYVDDAIVLAGDTVIHVGASALSTRGGKQLVSELANAAIERAEVL